jgi:hypothetical protein
MDHPFAPGGQTYQIGTAAVQIPVGAGNSFRIVNLLAAVTYIAWGPTNAVTVTAPGLGTPQTNTLALPPNAERTICIPVNAQGPLWWIASALVACNVTQGDGL